MDAAWTGLNRSSEASKAFSKKATEGTTVASIAPLRHRKDDVRAVEVLDRIASIAPLRHRKICMNRPVPFVVRKPQSLL